MTEPERAVPALSARTRVVDPVTSLLPLLDAQSPLLFMRRGEGVAGLGEALRLTFRGPDRIARAAETWRRVAAAAAVDDPVRSSGSGLLAFGAFTFDERSEFESVLIVPRTIIGRRDGVSWVTEVTVAGEDGPHPTPEATALGAEFRLALQPGDVGPDRFRELVARAVERIRAGELRKVVLARDLVGHLPEGGDLRRVLVDLALGYPDTWTFAIDGHIGSSPETLVRVNHGKVSARVLAGSIARGADADADHAAALRLATSTKDLDEHRYAVQSVLDALGPHARSGISASEIPFALKLPNLWHLATNIEGTLSDGSSALDLAAALHPTAAVAGTPTGRALEVIRELEQLDRGRYGGPVGWVDAHGDGKWAVSLRSAEIDAAGDIRAYAGGGILAASDPDVELAETKLKFRPIVEAFG
ncbi:isochorismate synthase [Protaetiibacter mangrovi]|uniref:isochorismate synthase n=1 Tax=Protaetiibacter mangrovi TaxID=2970926 RepID=A0ABT1ZG88_9MICO|nr:isochorismate synthase [Protaetiibacter mangrovi]MCS0499724.1 isochorismate synthase [Protaetiibacter mangrovi]